MGRAGDLTSPCAGLGGRVGCDSGLTSPCAGVRGRVGCAVPVTLLPPVQGLGVGWGGSCR